MTHIYPGRYTAQTDEPFVVFLIGMRINKLWAVKKWLPVVRAMPPMIETLMKHPQTGFMGGEYFFNFFALTSLAVQYWRSFEDLERFARAPSDPHLPAWKAFNQTVGNDGSVGIWHETYLVQPGQYEAIYGNMPRFGLAAAAEHLTISGRGHTARERISQDGFYQKA